MCNQIRSIFLEARDQAEARAIFDAALDERAVNLLTWKAVMLSMGCERRGAARKSTTEFIFKYDVILETAPM